METFPVDQFISLLTQTSTCFFIAPAQYCDTALLFGAILWYCCIQQ